MNEILEGNKLICEFMGYKHRFNFHKDWNDLMPVVEKISNIHYPDYWNGRQPDDVGEWDNCAYPRTFGMRDNEGNYMVRFNANVLIKGKTLIEATWLACVDFIKDYNEVEKPNNQNKTS